MALPTVAQFKARFPEFKCVDNETVAAFISEAALSVSEQGWGAKFTLGILFYTAHILFLSKNAENGAQGGVSGPVAGRSVDGVSVSHVSVRMESLANAWYSTTFYGQRYLELKKSLGLIVVTV